jgi:hypothetical protein
MSRMRLQSNRSDEYEYWIMSRRLSNYSDIENLDITKFTVRVRMFVLKPPLLENDE